MTHQRPTIRDTLEGPDTMDLTPNPKWPDAFKRDWQDMARDPFGASLLRCTLRGIERGRQTGLARGRVQGALVTCAMFVLIQAAFRFL